MRARAWGVRARACMQLCKGNAKEVYETKRGRDGQTTYTRLSFEPTRIIHASESVEPTRIMFASYTPKGLGHRR